MPNAAAIVPRKRATKTPPETGGVDGWTGAPKRRSQISWLR